MEKQAKTIIFVSSENTLKSMTGRWTLVIM
jgi:hypothetical protein